MRRGTLVAAATILVMLCGCSSTADRVLRIATTSSVDQSGLLATLLPAFKAESGVDVRAHVAGSGQALQMLARGDAPLSSRTRPMPWPRLCENTRSGTTENLPSMNS